MYKKISLCIAALLLQSNTSVALENKRPNILWLTFEDTSAFELSIYGNKAVKNPTLEKLASKGIVFNNASSAGPQCSLARSSLISGTYATTYGADHHRAPVAPSKERLYFPQLLKDSGYFTSNNSKRDYNVKLSNNSLSNIWNEFDKKASYNSSKRNKNQPFFSVFNANITHMSRLTSYTLEHRRDFTQSGVEKSAKPSYLPDLPEVQSDYQFHLEGVTDIDRWVQLFIDDLKERKLYEDTIIFVFSDHGGSSPRGKGFLHESTSLKVPLIIHVPEKYKHLVSTDKSVLSNKMLSFIDFGPSVLSLAGIKTPKEMLGQAFLGELATHDRQLNFGFRTNQDSHYDPLRSVTDGEYNYIKTYLRRKPIMLRNDFQWGMPSNIALDDFAKTPAGKEFSQEFYGTKKSDYLYHRPSDNFERVNLADNSEDVLKLKEFQKLVSHHIRSTKDLGFIPLELKQNKPFDQWLDDGFDLSRLHDLAELVSQVELTDLPELEHQLKSSHAVMRFWAAQGYAELAALGLLKKATPALIKAGEDVIPAVSTVAREALVYLQAPNAVNNLLAAKSKDHQRSALETIAYLMPERLLKHTEKFKKIKSKESRKVVLAALGVINSTDVATKKQREKGYKVNKDRRPLSPKP